MSALYAKRIGAILALLLLPLLAYQPCLEGDFIWDDDKYVSENPHLRTVDGLITCWTDPGAIEGAQFYPLVYTSFWLEYQTWKLTPYGYHRDNVLLHGLCAILLWQILLRLGVPGAFLAATLFALHPVCVESVAWITERKNTLSLAFALASLWAYLSSDRKTFACAIGAGGPRRIAEESGDSPAETREPDPDALTRSGTVQGKPAGSSTTSRSWPLYALALLLFACALLSKTVTTVLPVVIALLLWWKSDRLTLAQLRPLIPFVILGFVSALFTLSIEADHLGTDRMAFFQDLTALERCVAAGKASWFYIGKLLLPLNLSFIYPQLDTSSNVLALLPYLGWAAVFAVLWRARHRVGRGPLAAVLIYGVVVGPALGFFDIAQMRFSLVADHWVYHAAPALLALAAAGIAQIGKRLASIHRHLTTVALLIPLAALVALGTLTWKQCHIYQGLEPLWRDVLHKNPEAWIAHLNLGIMLTQPDTLDEALPHLQAAVRINPNHFRTHHALGNALMGKKQPEQAVPQYQRALDLRPTYPTALGNLGLALERLDRYQEAVDLYQDATRSDNDAFAAMGHYHLGLILLKEGHREEATKRFRLSLQRNPAFARPREALEKMAP